MRIGNHKSLTEMARKSPHNEEFVDNLKTATSEIFDQTMDKLLINKSAGSDEKIAVLEDLKDLRGAILASVKMPEAARKSNFKVSGVSPSRLFLNSRKDFFMTAINART